MRMLLQHGVGEWPIFDGGCCLLSGSWRSAEALPTGLAPLGYVTMK